MDLSLSGLASGFDWKTVVDQLIAVERVPQNRVRSEKSQNTTELGALADLKTRLTELQDTAKGLNESALYDRRATSLSNEDLNWTAGAADGTPAGTYSFSVEQVATRTLRSGAANVGGSISANSDVSGLLLSNLRMGTEITDGRFHINGEAVDVELTDTLQDIFDKIATATNGQVSASYDQATDRITLSGTGEVVLGGGNDTSNFLFATQLYNNGTGNVTSSAPLGTVDLDQPIATSGLLPVTAVDADGNGRFFVNGTEITFNVNTDSVRTLMSRINTSEAGATIRYDSRDDRFIMENAITGDRGLVLTEDAGGLLDSLGLLAGSSLTRGRNAEVRVNGGPVLIAADNTFDETLHGIKGLSVTAQTEGTQTVTVTSDTEDLKAQVNDFIAKYNGVQAYIEAQTAITIGEDGKVTTSTLTSNREVDEIGRRLRSLVFGDGSALAGAIRRLDDIGIGFASEGTTLEIRDQATLDNALAGQLDLVKTLFSDSTGGLAKRLDTFIGNITATDGTLDTQIKTIEKENRSLDEQIAAIERRLTQQREALTASFIRMEEAQSSMNSQLQALNNAINQK
ncbi:MAG: flagellar filament capping protein FliD [Opitutaceae bacterium]